jgi:hypothetical protein
LPLGIKEGFSYGGRLCSIVGWLGYGGNLTWRKQEYFIEYVLGIPISQGSLAKIPKWFQESLKPSYQQWLSYIQQPGVRCVDETTYCIDGIKYWLWVATSEKICVLMLAPTRSSAELEKLLGTDLKLNRITMMLKEHYVRLLYIEKSVVVPEVIGVHS